MLEFPFYKVADLNFIKGLKACNFIKKRLQHRCFPVNIRPQPLNCLVRVSFSHNTLASERMEAKKIGFFEKEHIHTAS